MNIMVGALNSKLTWYTARSAGLVAWALVTASIVWGLALSTRLVRRRGAPAWLLDLHKFLGTLAMVFVAVHLVALWADSYVYFGPREFLVPMASSWRPGATAWGIAAMYLLVAIQITSWIMRRLPRRLWHAIHLGSFPMFAAATVHGFTAGADRANLAVQWIALSGGLLVFFLAAFRLLAPRRRRAAVSNGARSLPEERTPRSPSTSRTPRSGRSAPSEPAVPA